MDRIRICVGQVCVDGEIDSSAVAGQIAAALPLSGKAAVWGEEIYFGIPLMVQCDDMVDQVDVGDIAYWPPGHAFCVFFGRTPKSRGNEIRPASPVSVIGHVLGDARVLIECIDGDPVSVEWLSDNNE